MSHNNAPGMVLRLLKTFAIAVIKLTVMVFAWCVIGTGNVLIKGGELILKLVKK